jgi:hypothetical protein
MKIEADTSAARVTHYSIFDRTPADIDDPDLAGDLDHLAASLDYLDYLASQKTFKKTSKKKSFGYQCRSFTGSSPVREGEVSLDGKPPSACRVSLYPSGGRVK